MVAMAVLSAHLGRVQAVLLDDVLALLAQVDEVRGLGLLRSVRVDRLHSSHSRHRDSKRGLHPLPVSVCALWTSP